jgi:serine protease Do
MMKRNSAFVLVPVALVLCVLLGCEPVSRAQDADRTEPTQGIGSAGMPAVKGLIDPSPFVAVVEKVMPAVVSIDTKKKVDTRSNLDFDEPFGRIFRDLLPEMPRREYEVPGYASGFIMDASGYVVTNHHVVRDAQDIVVTLADEREYPAEVVGSDPNSDIAVLKIEADGDLASVRLGDSDAIKVGDWAIAIGNPFGRLEGTVTVGVISAKGRSALSIVGGTPALQDFIQTDASINFGNSGGPLVNIDGDAIGMNTAINPLGQGLGFAIPINLVKHVAQEIIEFGKVSWGYLGVLPQEIDRGLAEALGVEPKSGILVGTVVEGEPADRAGLKRGDIIVEFDGRPVGNVDQFRLMVAEAGVGREIRLAVLRDGKHKEFMVKLGERPTEVAQATARRAEEGWVGLKVDDVKGTAGRRVAPSDVETGVVVVEVEENSPAEEAGIQVGDMIEEVNREEVASLSDYEGAKDKAIQGREKSVLFLVRRDDVSRYVAVKPRQTE